MEQKIEMTIGPVAIPPTGCSHPDCVARATWIAVAHGTTTSTYACGDHLGHVLVTGREHAVADLATIDAWLGPMHPWRTKSLDGIEPGSASR